MVDESFDVETFLRSIKATKPPWECPKCQKLYKSYIGIEYHLQNFDHTASTVTPNRPPTSSRRSKLKFSKKKKSNRFYRRSPSPVEFLSQTRETLTWAEAQRMVEVESEGKVYRLNIDEKLDIISDSDIDKDDDNAADSCNKGEADNEKVLENKKASCKINSDVATNDASAINLKDLRNVSLRRGSYATENQTANLLSTPSRSNKLPKPSFRILPDYDKETADAPSRSAAYYRYIEKPSEEVEEEIEYDMDEEDTVWLELMNQKRAEDGLSDVTHDQLELLMDRFEKESYFDQAKLGSNGSQPPIDEDAVCCVCNDGECQNSNVILFCDMCNLAVHQECYGVPYIPEGQWLCRRCLQSPSCPVDCCLCPSRTGAFKQTDDGRWAHVVCALWIPEVTFSNTVFLEPIDGLKNIPSARWKLTCYICKQKNAGACIQCHRTNCYVAFHVTCAQQAGLYMKMEAVKQTGRNGVTVTVKKEAFCEAHTPSDSPQRNNRFNGQKMFLKNEKKVGEKLKKSRKMVPEKQQEAPKISLPYIPRDKVSSIGRHVTIQKKAMFLQRLLSYWTLKRQARNGVPLLRRLQALVHQHRPKDPAKTSEQHQQIEQLKYWHRLRHDLERARLLIELIRKRERLKRETVRISQAASELHLTPFALILRRLLSKLEAIDVAQVFAEPVDENEAPDYYTFIKNPMDFATMAAKIDNQTYRSFIEFEDDFNLVVNNCMHYNERDTIFYRLAVKMRDVGGAYVRSTKREIQSTGLDLEAGLLLSTAPSQKTDAVGNTANYAYIVDKVFEWVRARFYGDNNRIVRRALLTMTALFRETFFGDIFCWKDFDKQQFIKAITDDSPISDLPLAEQLEIWQERLDEAILNSRKTNKMKSEILSIKKKIQEEEAKKKFEDITVPNRRRMTTRRFSADDVGSSVASAECEAVVSDVDSNFRISPKIRPVSFKPNRTTRKRLWSAKASLDAWEPTPKKSTLEERDSSPTKENTEKMDDAVLSEPGPLSPDPGVASESPVSDFSLNLNLSSPTENPSPNSTSVNRRTAVLFRKKCRRRPSKSSLGGSDSAPNTPSDPGTTKISKSNLLSSPDVTTDTDDDVAKPTATEKEADGLYINGYNTSQDENVFNEKYSPNRRESHDTFREQLTRSASQTESVSSDEGNRVPVSRKKRSYSCNITPTRLSSQSYSSTSFDEKSGFFTEDNADFPFEYLRRQSYISTTEEDTDEEDLPVIAPLDLVWAKCRGYPHYPALLIDPKMPRSGFCHNDVPIPVPPMDVLQVGDKRIENGNRRIYLVLFFDSKRTWQWLPRDKIEKLGVDPESDRIKLAEGRRPAVRRNVEAAFKRALHHRSKVNGEIPDSDDEIAPSSVNQDSTIKFEVASPTKE